MPLDVITLALSASRRDRSSLGKTILIVGGPGGGKMTLAAQLVRDLPVPGDAVWQTEDAIDPTIRKLRALGLDAVTEESLGDTRRLSDSRRFIVERAPRARVSKIAPFDRVPTPIAAVFDGSVLSHNDVLDLRDHAGRNCMSIVTARPNESYAFVELFDLVLRVREDHYTHARIVSLSENRLGIDAATSRYELTTRGFVLVAG